MDQRHLPADALGDLDLTGRDPVSAAPPRKRPPSPNIAAITLALFQTDA